MLFYSRFTLGFGKFVAESKIGLFISVAKKDFPGYNLLENSSGVEIIPYRELSYILV